MEILGYLVWWRLGENVRVPYTLAEQMARELQLPTPMRPAPVDVYRRLARETRVDFSEDGEACSLTLVKEPDSKKILVAKIVKSVFDKDGVPLRRTPVGRAVFHKPPPMQRHKARFLVTVTKPADEVVSQFADRLRREWRRNSGSLNSQALRRLIRNYLEANNALFLEAPYFLPSKERVDRLRGWFDKVGVDNRFYSTGVPDSPEMRDTLAHGLDVAVTKADAATVRLVEAYVPLGVVPESVWQRLERLGT